jgi:hypothetical protein
VRMKTSSQFFALIALATLLSALPMMTPFGALPLRSLRKAFGRGAFWLGSAGVGVGLMASGLTFFAVVWGALAVLIGAYSEVEEHGGSIFNSGLVAVLASLGMLVMSFGLWLHQTKAQPLVVLHDEMQALVTAFPNSGMTAEAFVGLFPAVVATTLIMALAVALIGNSSILEMFRLPRSRVTPTAKLSQFRAPDVMIWVMILALSGAYVHSSLPAWTKMVSQNVLIVSLAVFFFQGIAVLSSGFKTFRVSAFWRVLWYVILTTQFFFVCLIGLADHWVGFREKFTRRLAETKREV